MLKGNHKIFLNKQLLYQMINLRLNGYAQSTLALIFGCDRDSIQQQCRKYDIDKTTDDTFTIERIISEILPVPKEERFMNIEGEKICRGHSYNEYLKKAYPHRKIEDLILN